MTTGDGAIAADPGLPQRQDRLRQFIVLDALISAIATVFVIGVYLWVERNGWLIVVALVAGAAATTMAMGLRPLRHGDSTAAVWWLVAGNWGVALTTASVATFAWPIQIMAAVLPVVLAVSHVSSRQFRWMIGGAIVVGTTAAALGLLQDFSGLTDSVPEWVTDIVLIVFAPFMAVLITVAGAQSAESMRDSLQLSVAANESLRASERLLEEQAEVLRSSRRRIVAAADRERRRIERDLHDGAQQRLVGLSLQLSLAREQATGDPAAAQETLDRIRDEVRHAQEEMRALVQGLYPPVLTQHGLAPALRSMLGHLDNPLRSEIDDIGRLDPDREAGLYFVGLEAVQNVMKHTGPTTGITIRLTEDDESIRLEVADDGPGFDPGVASDGIGLANMEDRVGAAGGDVRITSVPGEGTTITATVPRA